MLLASELLPHANHLPQAKTITYPLLGQLPGLLVLGVPQQFHDSLLVRRETGDLSNDILDEKLLLAVKHPDNQNKPVSPDLGLDSRLNALSVGRKGGSGDDGGRSSSVVTESQV